MSEAELNNRDIAAAATPATVSRNGHYVPPEIVRQGSLVIGRKINIACVGIGGMGFNDAAHWSGENIVALCDVDNRAARKTRERNPTAQYFRDYREMLAKYGDKIDAVTVTTPDHTHFSIAVAVLQAGKHLYLQKPLTYSIEESRLLLEAARVHGVKTQMGNQAHSTEAPRLCKEWIAAGVIGDVKHIDVWTDRPVWPQNCMPPSAGQTLPGGVDWELWLNVGPVRPYHSCYMPFRWRGWWEFGTGALGDMGCQLLNDAYFALDLKAPSHVELLEADGGNEHAPPAGAKIKYSFPQRGHFAPCTLTWHEGTCKPPVPKELSEDGHHISANGTLFYGTKGILYSSEGGVVRLLPDAVMATFKKRPPKSLPRITGNDHYWNWLEAIRGNIPEACSNFEYAAPLNELCAIGNLAIRSGRSFDWDSAAMQASDPQAQAYVRRSVYRKF